MNDLKYFELHKNSKREYLAKGKNYITFDENWSFEDSEYEILYALEDFKTCLKKSFNVELSLLGSKKISFIIEKMTESFKITVEEDRVIFKAPDEFLLDQAIYYAEDVMKQFGDASLEKKEYIISQKIKDRFATSALENGVFTQEYINILLHFGYNGVIFFNHDEVSLDLVRKSKMKAFLYNDDASYKNLYDGVISEQSDIIPLKKVENKLEFIKKLDSDKTIILPFDENQSIERDGVYFNTKAGSLVMAQPSDEFLKCYEEAKKRGIKVWALNFASGRTNEFGSVPYIPAMMQWFMRNVSLNELEISATIESEFFGFIPSIVGEFTKAQNYMPCDEGGICIQKLASTHFGPENTEKIIMVFKKITDGVNYLIYNYADYEGPLQFGPAYPLINGRLYEYDFDKNDITLETDVNLKAADCFNKAAMILSHIDNDEAKNLMYILNFAVNTLVTCANTKRWYRRVDALEKTDTDYKKKFLYEQMLKIGEQEIKNAYDTAEILINAPFLEGNNTDALCTANALDAKIRLTENAINEIRKKIL